MKRTSSVPVFILITFLVFIAACTKIDTSTLGADLIPAADNIHTFEMILDVKSDNILFNDSTAVVATDDLPVGYTNDLEFGQTKSNLYFSVSAPSYSVYPFGKKDSIVTDSVILSLAYKGAYGDSNINQTFRVFEISQTSGFTDTTLFRISQPDFTTTGAQLGSRTFDISKLDDSVQVIRGKDTSKVIGVLRIPLDTAFGRRLMNYDTSYTANGGFYSDSILKTLFKGFAIQTDAVGNALTYYNVGDANTKLIVYYHYGRPDSTLSVEFLHAPSGLTNSLGVASTIKRTPGGNWNNYLNNPSLDEDLLYIPSTPGSYGLINIKGLDTMSNKVIHLAELILPKVPSVQEDKFTPQQQIFLDMLGPLGDTAFTIQNDLVISTLGSSNFAQFGGFLRNYNGNPEYHFNISRHVQGIVTRHEPNLKFRVYAPLETNVYYLPPGNIFKRGQLGKVNIPIVPKIGLGRVVLGGGSNSNPNYKLRLRIVYSKI